MPMSGEMVDFTFYGITKEQYHRILRRVTTTIVNIHFNKQFTLDNIYEHIEFIDGDITELNVANIRLK